MFPSIEGQATQRPVYEQPQQPQGQPRQQQPPQAQQQAQKQKRRGGKFNYVLAKSKAMLSAIIVLMAVIWVAGFLGTGLTVAGYTPDSHQEWYWLLFGIGAVAIQAMLTAIEHGAAPWHAGLSGWTVAWLIAVAVGSYANFNAAELLLGRYYDVHLVGLAFYIVAVSSVAVDLAPEIIIRAAVNSWRKL